MMQPPWKAIWSFLKILKIELLHGPAGPLLGIYPKNAKKQNQKNPHTISKIYIHHHAYCSLIYNSQGMETAYLSINR